MMEKYQVKQCSVLNQSLLVDTETGDSNLSLHFSLQMLTARAKNICKATNEYDKLKAKADVCDELVEALENYGQHHDWCNSNGTGKTDYTCSCGYHNALAIIAKVKGIE